MKLGKATKKYLTVVLVATVVYAAAIAMLIMGSDFAVAKPAMALLPFIYIGVITTAIIRFARSPEFRRIK